MSERAFVGGVLVFTAALGIAELHHPGGAEDVITAPWKLVELGMGVGDGLRDKYGGPAESGAMIDLGRIGTDDFEIVPIEINLGQAE